MIAPAFNTHAVVKKLQAAGFTEQQAEAQADVLAEIVETDLATKQDIHNVQRDIKELEVTLKRDIKELEVTLKQDIKELEAATQRDIQNVQRDIKELEAATQRDIQNVQRDIKEMEIKLAAKLADVRRDIEAMKVELLKWVIGLLLAQTGLIAALVKLL